MDLQSGVTMLLAENRLALCSLIVLVILTTGAGTTLGRERVAVLDFENLADLQEREVGFLSDVVREAARGHLPVDDYLLMTRENIYEMLPPGTTLADCQGDCIVETGRLLGADYVVAGDLVSFAGEFRATLRLYDTASGNQLASRRAGAGTLVDLEQPVFDMAGEVFGSLVVEEKHEKATEPATPAVRPHSEVQTKNDGKVSEYSAKFDEARGVVVFSGLPAGTFQLRVYTLAGDRD